jgi:hypothetical protein
MGVGREGQCKRGESQWDWVDPLRQRGPGRPVPAHPHGDPADALTLNYKGIVGLHQYTTLFDLDRRIQKRGSGGGQPNLQAIWSIPYGLRAGPGVEPKLYAHNPVRTDLGIAGFQPLTGVNIPDTTPTLQYDSNGLNCYWSIDGGILNDAYGIYGGDQTVPATSSPFQEKSTVANITAISTTAAPGKVSVTLDASHTFATGVKFKAVIAGVTGTPSINDKHLATATGTNTFTIDVATTGSYSGGAVACSLRCGGIIWASGEAVSKIAVGMYQVSSGYEFTPATNINNVFEHPLTRGCWSYQHYRLKGSNTHDEEADDLLAISINPLRESWPSGMTEFNAYLTMYRDGVVNDAALLCAAAMNVAYQRGFE